MSQVGDSGMTGIFQPLTLGGTVHCISPALVGNPELYAEYCVRHKIHALKVMPSVLKALQSSGRFAETLPHECIILGGEPCEISWVNAMVDARPGLQAYSHYGITETTVGSIVCPLTPRLGHLKHVPIGQPLAAVRATILDEQWRPVAPGMSGDLYLSGPAIGRGYLGKPARTATAFLPDPWSDMPGARCYRTGDVVTRDESGCISFRGRADAQIKIRGFRVAPGQVEDQLRRTGLVKQAAARLIKGKRPFLAAYVVPSDAGAENLEKTLRDEMMARVHAVWRVIPWVVWWLWNWLVS